jgi:thiol-disulfide isomerase/thioredoxin
VQKIILCPRCRVQVKRDNLGELLCPSCNVRLCPKAHIFDGKICPWCGWEDPNYSLWQKAQKDRLRAPRSRTREEPTEIKAQYVCSNCGVTVDSIQKRCPNCGMLGAKFQAAKVVPTGPISAPARPAAPVKTILDSIPRETKQKVGQPVKSTFVKEVAGTREPRWQFPSLRQFVRPVLASTLAGVVITGLVFGGIYIARFVHENIKPGGWPWTSATVPGDNSSNNSGIITGEAKSKTYILSTNVIPASGGEIRIVPPSSDGTFDAGSQVTLTVVPYDCYTVGYWDGFAEPSENITITMDSDKSITAKLRPKETTPPVISEVNADSSSDVSATVTWLTDKPATGQVDYGETKDYGLTAMSNDESATNHKVRMTGLKPNTTYYFSVKSIDKCGNEATDTKMLTTAREISYGERVGQRAIDFTLPYYNDDNPESPNKAGKSETLSTYLGGKKIMLNFWSTYCGACIGEFPYIRGIYEDKNFADRNSENSDFVVLTVCIDSNIDEAPGRIQTLQGKFIDEAGPFTFPILFDSVGQVKKDYHIWTIPETVFIDSDGIIRKIQIGRFQSQDEIETILKSLN